MCIRDRAGAGMPAPQPAATSTRFRNCFMLTFVLLNEKKGCLLYTSDAADERSSVDLGGRRIIKKKKRKTKMLRGTGKTLLRKTKQE